MQVLKPQTRLSQKTELHDPARSQAVSAGDLVTRFLRDRRGSTAIEFVALALPFALLVFAILESCLTFAGQEVLANATDDIARKFRTGHYRLVMTDEAGKTITVDETYLKNKICSELAIIAPGDCISNLKVDLRKLNSFKLAKDDEIIVADGKIVGQFKVDPGLSGTKNMLRVYYEWPVITDLMRRSMSNLKDGKTLLFATTTWQNEPFDD